ncbi:5-guanidino-2-oxopentanoate decarboxylase [Inquilinus limosus]|uniref:5-guanidino-2-oxopentanoate decarboxylase n=1 Tax=Inquilinus limosus TaxID=171674 RepID=UPI000403EB3B|nr:5-guanidino-2-oxopentanoate decarboxylase [Inquilinus limosus]
MADNCAQAIIDAFTRSGVDTAFGIPGVHTLELYRALGRNGLRHVAVRHEQGAAFMADGYARASGRPAICVLITGPGLLNAATGIGQAYSDSVPMVVLSTVNARADLGLGRGELHEMRNQRLAMEGLVASALTVVDPSQARAAADLSLARMALGRPRPVYIELPLDVATAEAPEDSGALPALPLPAPNPAALAQAAALLRGAKRPLILLGGGAVDAAAAARRLAESLGAVVACSIAGKGIVPDDGPHSIGARIGTAEGQKLIVEADVVLAVGTELSMTDRWAPLRVPGALIRVDIDPDVLVRDHRPAVPLLCDAGLALEGLAAALSDLGGRSVWAGDLEPVRRAADAAEFGDKPGHLAFLSRLRDALPDDAVVVTDMTQIAYTANVVFPARQPRGWLHPVGFGTLGYALPAAVGAKLARPDAQVVALAGDYGLGFTCQELGTAADLGLGLPVVVWNNRGLGQIAYGMDKAGIARLGVEIDPPAFDAMAATYGCGYAAVDDPRHLPQRLAAAFDDSKPTLIEVAAA